MRDKITAYADKLGLTVHPKKFYLQPTSRGVAFLGVVVRPGRTVLAGRFCRNLRKLKRAIDDDGVAGENLVSLVAYKGLAKHHNYRKIFEKIFGRGVLGEIKKWQDLA